MKLSEIKKELKGIDIHKMHILIDEDYTELVVSQKKGEDIYIELLEEGSEEYAERLTGALVKAYGAKTVKPFEIANC